MSGESFGVSVNDEGQGGGRKKAGKLPCPPPEGASLLTVCEAAYLLRSSVDLVYRLINRGQIPSVSVGAKRFVRRDSVAAYIEGQTTTRRPDAPAQVVAATVGLRESGLWNGKDY